jgi:hypothetical protein
MREWGRTARTALIAIVVVLAASGGCVCMDRTQERRSREGGAHVPPGCPEVEYAPSAACSGEGETYVFVMDVMELAVTDRLTGETPGFNLDGCNTPAGGTTGCGHMDRRFDIDQNGWFEGLDNGIDNQLAEVAPLFESVPLAFPNVWDGDRVLLLEVKDVDSIVDDSCVQVSFLWGMVPEEAELELVDGRVVPGQTFDIDAARSHQAGGPQPRITAQGILQNGRVFAGPMALEVVMAGEGGVTPLDLHTGYVAFDMTADGLDVGVIGGGLELEGFLDGVGLLMIDDFPPEIWRSFLEPLTDLEPDANNLNCESVSVGLTFTAVPAMRGSTVGD